MFRIGAEIFLEENECEMSGDNWIVFKVFGKLLIQDTGALLCYFRIFLALERPTFFRALISTSTSLPHT